METDIHKQINCLHKTLGQRRTELVGQLHQHTQQKLKGLAAQRDQCELIQTQFSSCVDYVEGSLKLAVWERYWQWNPCIEQITSEFKPNTLAPQQEADIHPVIDDILDLQMSCRGFAKNNSKRSFGLLQQELCHWTWSENCNSRRGSNSHTAC